MTKTWFNKNSLLSALLALTFALILSHIIPVSVDPVLKLVISKNRVSIEHIDQPRAIESTKEVMVDIVSFAEQYRFKHPKLGEVGFENDFFVDIETEFTVNEAGKYQFIVASDDGFSLTIDTRRVCDYPSSRPLTKQTCQVQLSAGKHTMALSYYQGYGHAGLQAKYRKAGTPKFYWVGENSPALRFH